MPSERVSIPNSDHQMLAGVIERPTVTPSAFAVFAHCFTCSKDLKAIVRISRNMAKRGIATLRFDFRGIGSSQGKFEDSTFESNVADLITVIEWAANHIAPPKILIGHSLGGAAAMAVAGKAATASIDSLTRLKALVTLAAPSCTRHLADYLISQNSEIESKGQGDVIIGGRAWTITTQLINSLRDRGLENEIRQIRLPHLIFHSPEDQTVVWRHALTLLEQSGGAASLITLDGSDHLMVKQKNDVDFVADIISTWAGRYV